MKAYGHRAEAAATAVRRIPVNVGTVINPLIRVAEDKVDGVALVNIVIKARRVFIAISVVALIKYEPGRVALVANFCRVTGRGKIRENAALNNGLMPGTVGSFKSVKMLALRVTPELSI